MYRSTRDMPWIILFGIVSAGFASIYFSLSITAIFLIHKIFPALKMGKFLDARSLQDMQPFHEIGNSLIAIAIFGLYGVLTLKLDEMNIVHIDWRLDWSRLPIDLLVITLWNEIHFYTCHRFLHTRWLYRHVHITHHRSVVPTPFSTYSFHWFESTLLGSVMIMGMLFYDYTILALILFPLVSLTFNTIGHLNYDLFPEKPLEHILSASRRHGLHHSRVNGNFGFTLPHLDTWFKTRISDLDIRSKSGNA